MYLKSIEVQGFKSFANKLTFEFHNGITCIVGPNGSGKSNVADAVRWVLGEQSAKQLRGANMQDVIFSGTESRKPQGYAYVAITLDNADHKLNINYDEVTVSRKVFRSGESEYKINGVSCRLRDVYELFYDTGIGKEGYSIIGQGQIEKILSNKPDERRELFDEAVGIVKYKHRKATTLKKLESEHANLVRVSDILFELEKQVGPLARQSETAKKYLKLRDELKVYDLQMFALDQVQSSKKLSELQEKEEIVSGDLEDTKKSLDDLKVLYEEVDNEIQALDEKLQKANEDINRLTTLKSDTDGQVLVLREQINTEKTNESHINERLERIRDDLESFEENKQIFLKKKEEIVNLLSDKQTREKEISDKILELDDKIAEHLSIVEADKSTQMKLLTSKTDVAAKLSHFDTLKQQVLLRRGEISSRLLRLKSEQETAVNQKEELLKKQKEIHAQIKELREKLQALKTEQQSLLKEKNALSEKKAKLTEQFHMINAKAKNLKGIEEQYEGFQNSIRRIMEYKAGLGVRGKEIEGVVSELIHVEKQYETAIEIALSGAIQNVVTTTSEMAKQCISYLKQNKLGRATFLPLDQVKSNGTINNPQALKEEGVIGIASNLITFDKKYQGIFDFLLGRVLIVDHIDHATQIAKKYHQSIRMVTLEGDLISPGGSMTGGAFKNNSNILGRKREIMEAEEGAALLRKEIANVEKELAQYEEKLASCLQKGQAVSDKLQNIALSDTTLSVNISQFTEKIENARVLLADAANENAQIEKELGDIAKDRGKVEEEISRIEKENTDSSSQVLKWSKLLEQEQQQRETLFDEVGELRLEIAKMKQSMDFNEENISRISSDSEKIASEAQELLERLSDTTLLVSQRQEEILNLTNKSEEYEKLLVTGRQTIADLSKKRQKIMVDQKDFFVKQQDITTKLNDLEMEKYRLENEKDKLDAHLNELTDYLYAEYEMMPSEVAPPSEEITKSIPEIKREIAKYKAEIKGLGHVNVQAIEEYKEVSERYEFMKGQYEDLTKAEQALQGIINELDDGMRKQFTEQFARIQTEFDRVFKELFGGGSAKLELVEGEDVIEAGIRIISQPPGKKLSNMMQLSGGEKALTAIALLFAIQSLKPSPFCLLDEIEAALDDSNVSRFAGYLHKLTDETQFILISHRRGTMVMADRLYGITMQEKGVSTLVSVNLIESELDN